MYLEPSREIKKGPSYLEIELSGDGIKEPESHELDKPVTQCHLSLKQQQGVKQHVAPQNFLKIENLNIKNRKSVGRKHEKIGYFMSCQHSIPASILPCKFQYHHFNRLQCYLKKI